MNLDERQRWSVLARTLALEVLVPVWQPMGLDFVDPPRLRRHALVLLREEDVIDEVELPRRLGEAAKTPHGADAADRFVAWGNQTWVTRLQHHPDWFGLRRAAHRACSKPERYKVLNLPKRESRDFKRRYDATMDMGDVEAMVASLRQRELSDLDVEVCLRAGFDPHVPSFDFFSPVVPVSRMHRFQALMREVVAGYSAEALESLRQGLATTARALALPIDPPPLSELVARLPS